MAKNRQDGIETKEYRKALKEHITAAGLAGLEATLRAGREADEAHNRLPQPEKVKSTAEILREAREVAESIPVHILVESADGSVVTEKHTDITFRDGQADTSQALEGIKELEKEIESMPKREEVKEESKNTTKTVKEQLAEARALLERLEKENSTG